MYFIAITPPRPCLEFSNDEYFVVTFTKRADELKNYVIGGECKNLTAFIGSEFPSSVQGV